MPRKTTWSRKKKPSLPSVIQHHAATQQLVALTGWPVLYVEAVVARLVAWVHDARRGPRFSSRPELPHVLGVPQAPVQALLDAFTACGWIDRKISRHNEVFYELRDWENLFPEEAAAEMHRRRSARWRQKNKMQKLVPAVVPAPPTGEALREILVLAQAEMPATPND